jgi:hypothetical protein
MLVERARFFTFVFFVSRSRACLGFVSLYSFFQIINDKILNLFAGTIFEGQLLSRESESVCGDMI